MRRTNPGYIRAAHTWQPELGPVPRTMAKFNPGLSQILSTVFLSKNMLLELTKYFCVFTPRFSDDNIEFYSRNCTGR